MKKGAPSLDATRTRKPTALSHAALTKDELQTLYIGLVRTYHGTVYGYVSSLVSDRGQAEDLTQDTFVKAFVAFHRIGAPDSPRAWLLRIATNLTIDHFRRGRRLSWVSLDRVAYRLRGVEPTEQVDELDAVQRALAQLSPDHRSILLLFAHMGLKTAEVADVLAISPAAARKRRQRAREAFTRAYVRGSE